MSFRYQEVSATRSREANHTPDSTKKGAQDVPFSVDLLVNHSTPDGGKPPVPLLPATYRYRHKVRLVSDSGDLSGFLRSEFDLTRLNCIHNWLWLCGLPSSPRSLHYQRLKKRDIVVSEQLDLHLVWSPARIFIKPLPRFLFSPGFWRDHICPSPQVYKSALGFLLSYIALIEREVDYVLAIELHLIPAEITWPDWLAFAEEVVLTSSQARSFFSETTFTSSPRGSGPHSPINPRFYYGELRLGRLNWIHRLVLGEPRGYMSGCTTYGAFIRENVNSLITLFAYTTIVLSAMQVGLSTQWLAEDYAFGMASYVFSVFAILAPLSALLVLLIVLSVLFTINLIRTLRIRSKRIRQGAGV